jgi:hypothetical protein
MNSYAFPSEHSSGATRLTSIAVAEVVSSRLGMQHLCGNTCRRGWCARPDGAPSRWAKLSRRPALSYVRQSTPLKTVHKKHNVRKCPKDDDGAALSGRGEAKPGPFLFLPIFNEVPRIGILGTSR